MVRLVILATDHYAATIDAGLAGDLSKDGASRRRCYR